MFNTHVERAFGQFHTRLRLNESDRRIENIEHLRPTSNSGLGLVEDLADLGNRSEDQLHEEQTGHQTAGVEAPRFTEPNASHSHRCQRNTAEGITQREHEREPTSGAHLRLELRLDGIVKTSTRTAL
ncbi:unannotated protein [freshwater metagenome]|uniref:Unannotated protein n=1 Tax=freshwater metagenome TaxID=449393 RepID=A0A6J6G073_9ZZZZ